MVCKHLKSPVGLHKKQQNVEKSEMNKNMKNVQISSKNEENCGKTSKIVKNIVEKW